MKVRGDLGRSVQVESDEAHWHVARLLRDLAKPEVLLTDLDILEAG